MLIVLGSVTLRKDSFDEALALSQQHVARSRLEPGCIAHAVHGDLEQPNRLVFVERWADRAALQAHFVLPASRGFVKQLMALADAPPEMAVYEAAAVSMT